MAYRNPRFMFAHALRDAAEGSVEVVNSSASLYDPERLWDGLIRAARGFTFGTTQANHFVAVDTGAVPVIYNRMIIPAGHNLGGATYFIEDDDNSTFTSAATLKTGTFAAGTALIDIDSWTNPQTQRYLRLRISTSGDWTLAELVFTQTRQTAGGAIARGPDPAWVDQPATNVNVTRMRSGEAYALRLGPQQRVITYEFNRISGADLTLFEDLLEQTGDGSQPFYIDRTDDSLPPLYVRLSEQVTFTQDRKAPRGPLGPSYRVKLSVNEEIA